MMNIKTGFFFGAVILIFAGLGCKPNKGNDFIFDGDAPRVFINGQDIFRDTFKYSLQDLYTLDFTIDDDQSNRKLSMSRLDNALVYYNNNVLNNAIIDLNGTSSGELSFKAFQPGFFSFFLTVTDPENKSSTALIEMIALDNLLPVAALQVAQTNEVAPYQVKIDASASVDSDSRWGGTIEKYEYNLEGFYTTESIRDNIDYIFPGPGTYRVHVRVKDNDGAWSPIVTREIVVN
jgi:hypothetical protein